MSLIDPRLFLDPVETGTLQERIRRGMAASIGTGALAPGERLPSTRGLAALLGVARITITLAFQELVADGWLDARDRSGYFVAEKPPFVAAGAAARTAASPSRQVSLEGFLQRRYSGARLVAKTRDWARYPFPFVYGDIDPSLFDHGAWRQCAHRALGRRDFDALTRDHVEGDDPELVECLAGRFLARRGIAAGPENILVTIGAQNALWLVASLLIGPGVRVAYENPGYPGLRAILRASGGEAVAVDVDAEGLDPDAVPLGTRIVFTTPSHQAPTTVTMPLARRQRLLERAARDDFLVVEDDYDFEISFHGPPRPALKSLDAQGRVVYVGSFSKSLFPGLRLGYLVGPPELIAEARALRSILLRHPPGHVQRTTAYFIALGHYDASVRRLVDAFGARRRAMRAAIDEHGLHALNPDVAGGTSFWMRAPDGIDTRALAARLRERDGVVIEPGDAFFGGPAPPTDFYRIAYSSIPASSIAEGVRRIAGTIAASAPEAGPIDGPGWLYRAAACGRTLPRPAALPA